MNSTKKLQLKKKQQNILKMISLHLMKMKIILMNNKMKNQVAVIQKMKMNMKIKILLMKNKMKNQFKILF